MARSTRQMNFMDIKEETTLDELVKMLTEAVHPVLPEHNAASRENIETFRCTLGKQLNDRICSWVTTAYFAGRSNNKSYVAIDYRDRDFVQFMAALKRGDFKLLYEPK